MFKIDDRINFKKKRFRGCQEGEAFPLLPATALPLSLRKW